MNTKINANYLKEISNNTIIKKIEIECLKMANLGNSYVSISVPKNKLEEDMIIKEFKNREFIVEKKKDRYDQEYIYIYW